MGRPCIYPKAITREARDKAYRQFSTALTRYGDIFVYWLAGSERIAFRSVAPARRRTGALPASAILVGRFRKPFSPSRFVTELDAMLAQQGAE